MSPIRTLGYVVDHAFRTLLASLVDARFESRRAFARAVEPNNVDGAGSLLSQILRGRSYPPMDRIGVWADVLGLVADERQNFIDLAACSHLPDAVRPEFERIIQKHRELVRKHKLLLSIVQSKLNLNPNDIQDLDIKD